MENLVCADFANLLHDNDFEIISYVNGIVILDNLTINNLDELLELKEDLGISKIDVTKKSLARYPVTLF